MNNTKEKQKETVKGVLFTKVHKTFTAETEQRVLASILEEEKTGKTRRVNVLPCVEGYGSVLDMKTQSIFPQDVRGQMFHQKRVTFLFENFLHFPCIFFFFVSCSEKQPIPPQSRQMPVISIEQSQKSTKYLHQMHTK